MKRTQLLVSFIGWLVVAGMIQQATGMSAGLTLVLFGAATMLLAMTRPSITGVMKMESVDVQMWAREITKRFWKMNLFTNYMFDEGQYVVGGAAVLIPQPGARADTVKNRTVYPATAVRRADNTIMYVLDTYTTDPTHIPNVDIMSISYDKRASIIDDLFGGLLEDVSDDMLIKMANGIPKANIVYTTGGSTEVLEEGQSGSRRAMDHLNLKKAANIMNKQNVPKDGRVALIEENMFDQMVDSLGANDKKDFSRVYDPASGTIGRLYGFDLMTRSSVTAATNGVDDAVLAAVPYAAEMAATDNVTSLCWHKNTISKALGTTRLYQDIGNPLYYGDIFSSELRMGGRVRRADFKGIVAISQSPVTGG